MYVANHADIQAIATFTETGSTPMRMSRISSGIPIFAMIPDEEVCRRVTMYRGVVPIRMKLPQSSSMDMNRAAMAKLKELNIVQPHDLVIITTGEMTGQHGGTNTMKIMQIE